MEHTTWQHLHWKYLIEDIHRTRGTCPTCQKNKKHSAKCRHFPAKNAETCPWETLCVDLTGPHAFQHAGETRIIIAVCYHDKPPSNRLVEIAEIPTKESTEVANIVEKALVCEKGLVRAMPSLATTAGKRKR